MEKTKILVWDMPVRVFHWLLVATFAGAFLTAESEQARDAHFVLGYTFLGLLAFRLAWGVVGSRYARFVSFAFGPRATFAYLRSLATRHPDRYVGHNPAGSWAIYAMIVLGIVTGVSGYAVYNATGASWMESVHEGAANILLGLAIVHVVAVVVSSFMHSENLIAAMVTGRKSGYASEAISGTRRGTAAALMAGIAVLWSGALDFRNILSTADGAAMSKENSHSGHSWHRDRDDDG